MEHQRVIEILKTLYKKSTKVVGGRLKGGYIDHKTQENKAINTAIQTLEKQLKDRWIPVSERLPGDEEINKLNYSHPNHRKFLCTIQITDYKPQVRLLYYGEKGWLYEGENYNEYVKAWRYLPEPYKGE